MNDERIANQFIQRIRQFQSKRQGGTISAAGLLSETKQFEDQYAKNCSCPIKKGRGEKHYRMCDCAH